MRNYICVYPVVANNVHHGSYEFGLPGLFGLEDTVVASTIPNVMVPYSKHRRYTCSAE